MLNISQVTVEAAIEQGNYASFKKVSNPRRARTVAYLLIIFFLIFLVVLFLPWTQNITAKGKLTTLYPEDRPQTIFSTIPGRIERWFVREGQRVEKGDTIVWLSEVKPEYFDPELLRRTREQLDAKEKGLVAYQNKIDALKDQYNALQTGQNFKLKQLRNKVGQMRNKVVADSAALEAERIKFDIARNQYDRYVKLYESDGIISQTELEKRRGKLQETSAKLASLENKYLITQNELINSQLELTTTRAEYQNKMAKNQSERSSAESALFEGQVDVAKMRNRLRNYEIRAGYYYVTAPQDCYITKVNRRGLGEILKEGDILVDIMPADPQLAVELYVQPMDVPLVHNGEEVQLIFDGWPSIVFSGWPGASFGTFQGKIVGMDRSSSQQGMYRVLVAPAHVDAWPKQLLVGSGTRGMALLNDVPVWYEIWRQLNGFPPEFYTPVLKEGDAGAGVGKNGKK